MMTNKGARFCISLLMLSIVFSAVACTGSARSITGTTERLKEYITVAKVGGDYQTIQEAVNAAVEGLTIKVHGGTYHESVTVSKAGLVIEAFDPVAEPVIVDGSDQSLTENPLAWESAEEGIYRADYEWPLTLPDEAAYSTRGGEGALLQVYEDGSLLRGYRDPFDERYYAKKTLVFFETDTYGLAGPYSGIEQLDANDRKTDESFSRAAEGRFWYDSPNKKLYVAPAAGKNPSESSYEIPVLNTLFFLTAERITLRNLVLTNAADYAVQAENAEGGTVESCFFKNVHFAVALKKTEFFVVRDNVVEERGFYERYAPFDVTGTMYEKSAIALLEEDDNAQTDADTGILVTGNILRGVPFFIPPVKGRLVVENNLISYSVFGLFASTMFWSKQGGLVGSVEIRNNVLHHLDGGIGSPRTATGGGIICLRNCFYLDASVLPENEPRDAPPGGLVFFQNTLAFAGGAQNKILPFAGAAGMTSVNNLYYVSSFAYKVFVDNGSGDPWPVLFGPQLFHNMFVTPPAAGFSYGTYTQQDELYVYQRIAESGEAADQAPGIFAFAPELETVEYFNETFDPPGPIEIEEVFGNGLARYCQTYFLRIQAVFNLDEKSPARDNGRDLPADCPDDTEIADEKPDLGAREL